MRRLRTLKRFILAVSIMLSGGAIRAEDLDLETAAKVEVKLKDVQAWAADAVIVRAVQAQNENPPPDMRNMNQQTWKALSILDPMVRKFTKNAVGQFLKSKKDVTVSEAFVSSADGTKVGFLSKPTYWNHTGKAKHDDPMKGEIWRGPVEVDESTGVQQMQVAAPILDADGKPIGSLVVGLEVNKLKN
jgi:hypothetical protein